MEYKATVFWFRKADMLQSLIYECLDKRMYEALPFLKEAAEEMVHLASLEGVKIEFGYGDKYE